MHLPGNDVAPKAQARTQANIARRKAIGPLRDKSLLTGPGKVEVSGITDNLEGVLAPRAPEAVSGKLAHMDPFLECVSLMSWPGAITRH